jgi:hypothetical protein
MNGQQDAVEVALFMVPMFRLCNSKKLNSHTENGSFRAEHSFSGWKREYVYASLPYPDTLHPILAKMLGPDTVFTGGFVQGWEIRSRLRPLQHDEKAGVGNLRVAFVVGRRIEVQVPYHATCSRKHLGRISRSAGCLRSRDDTRCVCFWDYLFLQTTFRLVGPSCDGH